MPSATVVTDHDGRVAIDWGVYPRRKVPGQSAGIVVEKQIGGMTPEVWQGRFLPHLGTGMPAGAKAGA